ncbi:MAG: amino acid adenylation domain-containing protein [Candidatus Sericytochromatia bacterium]
MKIAIIGLACKFPKANNKDEFWHNLITQKNCISDVPKDRWDIEKFHSENPQEKGKMNTKKAGFIDDIELFDADFFNISSLEAESLDPQQRLLLETTYNAIQDAGIITENLKNTNTGVFIGISSSDYSYISRKPEQVDMYSISGVSLSVASNRISYFFDLKGPSVSIDTACSSSLTATHLACQSLINKESSIAIVGGSNIILNPMITVGFSQAQGTSSDGKCSAFDAKANGMVRGEGVGILILKPLDKAIDDKDKIYAVIENTAINQDGRTNGLLAPSPEGQKNVLELAYKNIDRAKLIYVEAHGTGTVLGDPIEAKSLGEVLGKNTSSELKIGSVKTNIGHLEAAAGIAGLIKTVLCIYNKKLVSSLNYETPNPYIPFENYNLKVQTQEENIEKNNFLMGVSSFGFGGTNAHVVLSNFLLPVINTHDSQLVSEPSDSPLFNQRVSQSAKTWLGVSFNNFILLSANTKESLKQEIENYSNFIKKDNLNLKDLIYTIKKRKNLHRYKYSLGFSNIEELSFKLEAFNEKNILAPLRKKKKIAFVFSGMGAKTILISKKLLENKIFRDFIEKCDLLIKNYYDWSLIEELQAENYDVKKIQPILFSVQAGIAKLFEHYGLKPEIVLGSSVGEVPAAYISGALSLEDAIKVSCIRANSLISMIGTGKLAIIRLDRDKTKEVIKNYDNVFISACNSKNMTIVSSTEESLLKLEKDLKEKDIFFRIVKGTEAPSHCPLMESVKDFVLNSLVNISPKKTSIDFYSTFKSEKIDGNDLNNLYWWENLKNTIEFYKTISNLEEKDNYLYIEIGFEPILKSFIEEVLEEKNKISYVFETLNISSKYINYNPLNDLFEVLGKISTFKNDLYLNDFELEGNLIDIPEYPWQKEFFWLTYSEDNLNSNSNFNLLTNKKKTSLKISEELFSLDYLNNLDLTEKKDYISRYLAKNISKLLKIEEKEINKDNPLKNFGIGSLMGMELFNRLKNDFKITLPLSKILKGPSINEITNEILLVLDNSLNEDKINKNTKKDKLIPLSFPQKRLWFLNQLEKGLFAYNIPSALKFEGEINYEALEMALNLVIKKHENLRTIFKIENNTPYQVILDTLDIKFEVEDFTRMAKFNFILDNSFGQSTALPLQKNDINNNQNINELLKNESSIPFNLEKAPLLRAKVFKFSENLHIILLTIHHIIADGFSLKILFEEIIAFYIEIISNSDIEIEKLKYQYADFSLWQKECFEKNKFKKQEEYWLENLTDIPNNLDFSFDKPRQKIQTFNGAMNNFEISEDLLKRLESFSKEKGVTVFALLLAVYNILLYKYTNQKDIIVGTPITGRNEPQWENLIGLFLNMLPLRSKIDTNKNFLDFLEQISETTLNAYDNQDVPFERIVEIINPDRNTSYSPIFQTIMALHASVDLGTIGNTKVTYIDVDMKTSKFDLVLSFIPMGKALKGAFEYNTDLFFDETIEQMKNHFFNILNLILITNPKISEISIFKEEEKQKIISFSSGKNEELIDISIIDIFNQVILKYPNNIAIKEKNKALSYKELDINTEKIKDFILEKGIQNSLVAILFERSSELITSIFGILKSNNFYLPLDIENTKKRNERIINDSIPKLLITSKNYIDYIPDNIDLVFIEDILEKNLDNIKNTNLTQEKIFNPSRPIYVIYTSGSSGKPKGVLINQKNLLNLVNWHIKNYSVSENTNSSLIAGVSFDASVWEIFPYILSASTINIPEKTILEKTSIFIDWLENKKIDIAFIPTPLFEIINNEELSNLKHITNILVGGAKLNKIPKNIKFNLYNHYGPTENTVVSTYNKVTNSLSIGKPIFNVNTFVLDEDLNLCPIGVKGELYLSGISLSEGYYNNAYLNNFSFIQNSQYNKLYKTGDLVKWNKNYELEFLGRKDEQVKVRGVRIELSEIENIINSHNLVKNSIVIFQKDRLIAYILPKEKFDILPYLIENLPSAFIPKIFYIDNLPLNKNGKIDIKELNRIYLGNNNPLLELETSYTEKELISIFNSFFKEDSNYKNITSEDNFFDLGGHSLLAIQSVDKISKFFDINLEIKELFSYPKIKDLAKLIELKQKEGNIRLPDIILNDNKYELFPLTEIQEAYLVGRGNMEFGNISAHAYLEIEVENLDINKLEIAFNKIINRHNALRTIIVDNKQKVLKEVPYYKIQINEGSFLELRENLSHEKLDYSQFPIFNLKVTNKIDASYNALNPEPLNTLELKSDVLNKNKSIIHYSFDAIFTDATSILIIAKELNELYNNPNLFYDSLELSFRDYVLYSEKIKETFLYKKSKDYWMNRINNFPLAPQLYTSKLINSNKSTFKRLEHKIKSDTWNKIKSALKSINITPNIFLITCFSYILSYWSKNSNFALNITLFNRLQVHKDINNILGDFTSLNLLEINLDKKLSFIENANFIQKQLLDDIDNRYFGGVSFLRELTKNRGFEASMMPIVFTSMIGNNSFSFDDFFGKITYSITQTPQVWLDHQVAEISDELVFNWDYLENIFPEKMITDMFNSYCNLINIFSEDLEKLKEKIILNSFYGKYIDFITYNYNNNIKSFVYNEKSNIELISDKNNNNYLLHYSFFENVKKYPNKIAIVNENKTFTYKELFYLVNNTANKIKETKNDNSNFIGVYLEKGWKEVVAVLAILSLGYAYVPLNIDFPKERNDYIIKTCEIETIISDIEEIDFSSYTIKNIDSKDINFNDTAYIIFTSGSTGIPKGVEISHLGAMNTILDINKRFDITNEDSIFAISSLNFDLSVYDIFGLLTIGGTIIIPSKNDLKEPSTWSKLLLDNKVTIWNSVPALMNMYVEYCQQKEDRFSNYLKTIMLSGDWIPLDLPNKIRQLNNKINLISLGGATEASIWSIFYEIKEVDKNWNSIPYGYPLTNQTFYVLDKNLEICPEFVEGDLYIGGIGLAKSYYKDQEKTNKAFIIHPETKERLYKTGDLGRFLPNGYIEFLGRNDYQVKINGYRIEIGEIESALSKYPKINNSIVITDGDKHNKKLVAYLETINDINELEIINFLSDKLPDYMIPKIFIKLEKFPLTDNGKVDRANLPNYLNLSKELPKNLDNDLLSKIHEIITKNLNIKELSFETDLLSIGANSIDIVRISNNLEQEFGFSPKISDIFRLKTINLIAEFYEKNGYKPKEIETLIISDDILEVDSAPLVTTKIIIEPKDREIFKNKRLALRNLSGKEIKLFEKTDKTNYDKYKTTRLFSNKLITLNDFSNFLSVLQEIEVNNTFKYLYPSAGSLYPVQIYFSLKNNAIENLEEGLYYYHPQKHSIIKITDKEPKDLYLSFSKDIYNSSKFSIFLISDLKAIEPLYLTSSIEYSYIESGCITQLLRESAPNYNLGLCSIGQINNEELKNNLNLDEKYLVLHTILGGYLLDNEETEEIIILNEDDEEWEEIFI